MKSRKNILKFSLLAGLLACLLIAGSLFASGAATADDNLNIIVTVPSGAVAQGETFKATVKIANESIESFKLAGLQVELAYDTALLTATADSIDHTLDETVSTAVSNVSNGQVKFVCVKNEFTEAAGYTTLSDLFTVEFTANSAIANPATLFSKDDVTYLMGDTAAMEIVKSDVVYGADNGAIALAILNTNLELVISESLGSIVVAPTPENATALSKGDLETALGSSVTVTAANGVIGTGAKIAVDGEEADVVVMGDIDGDGVVTVFDAMMVKKANSETAEDADKFADEDIKKFAADLNSDNAADADDATGILTHVVGKQYIG